jgi:hypothetical protein
MNTFYNPELVLVCQVWTGRNSDLFSGMQIQNRARQQGILGGNFGIGRKFWNLGGNFRTLKC